MGILEKTGLKFKEQSNTSNKNYSAGLDLNLHQGLLASLGAIQGKLLAKIDIDQPVFYAEFDYDLLLKQICALKCAIFLRSLNYFILSNEYLHFED